MDKSKYEEVNSADLGTRWEIAATEKNGMKFKADDPGNCKEGYYLGGTSIPGKDGKPFLVHSVQTVGKDKKFGDIFAITGGAVLDDKMKEVKPGSWLGIEYLGRKHKKGIDTKNAWTQTNSYHNWFVGVIANAPSYTEAQAKSKAAGGETGKTPGAQAEKKKEGITPNKEFLAEKKTEVVDDDLPF